MNAARFFSALVTLALLASCTPPAPPPVDLAAERESLIQTDRDFSTLSADSGAAAAFAHFLAEDALGLPAGGEPTLHRDSLVASLQGDFSLTWTPQRAEVAAAGDLGWTWGRYVVRSAGPDGAERVSYGKYLNVWRKDADGNWRVIADIGNGNPAPEQ